MDSRTRNIVVAAIWVAPMILGFALATWIILPTPRKDAGDGPLEERSRDDHDRLQGTWEGIRVERDGRIIHEGKTASRARVTFVGHTVIFEDQDTRLEGVFRVDQDQMPRTLDLTVTEGNTPVTYPSGIYRLSGNILRLCFAFPSTVRPTSFQTSPGSGQTLFVYRRILTWGHEAANGEPPGEATLRSSIALHGEPVAFHQIR